MMGCAGVGCSALVLLMVSLGAAVEVFDAAGPGAGQMGIELDPGMFSKDARHLDLAALDPMFARMLDGLMRDQDFMMQAFRPNFVDLEISKFPPSPKEVYKRLPSARRSQPLRPQQKWKIKKGKALGSQMVCYFKLCAFRSPH